jgi:hypothetical protein
MDGVVRVSLVVVCSVIMAALLGCGSDPEDGEKAATAGNTSTGGGGSSQGGSTNTSGSAGVGGVEAGSSGAGGASGGGGGASQASCAEAAAGVWLIPGYPAYLQIDDCQVPLFCDLDKGYHTTGYLEGDVITLTGVATLSYTVTGDVLTLLDGSSSGDILFARQSSADVIPAECYP